MRQNTQPDLSHTLGKVVAATILLVLSACATVPPGPPPPPPAALMVPAASAASIAIWNNSLGAGTRATEQAELDKYPQLAARAGTTLYILRDGRVLTTRESNPQACGGFGTCEVWFFSGAIALASDRGQENFARLIFTHGEGFQYGIVNAKGANVWIGGGKGLASPDGLIIAAGLAEVDEMGDDNRLRIIDWKGDIPAVEFAPSCLPLAWSGNQSFSVRCTIYGADGNYAFLGTVRRGTGGLWTISETERLNWETFKPLKDGKPLKTWQGEVVPPAF